MALTVTHTYVSTIPEAPGSGTPGGLVGPNEWNAAHTVSGTLPAGNIAAGGVTNSVQFNTGGIVGGSPNFMFDGTRVLVGTASDLNVAGLSSQVIVANSSPTTFWASFGQFSGDANAGTMNFVKSRNPTIGGQTIVNTGDGLGNLSFYGSDGTGYRRGARIMALAEGTPATGTVSGRLSFWTTPAGTAQDVIERMRIDSNGLVTINTLSGVLSSLLNVQFQVAVDSNLNNVANWIAYNGFSGAHYFDVTNGPNPNTQTAVSNNQLLHMLVFRGSDGTAYRNAVNINGTTDGTPATGTVPGRFIVGTTPAGVSQTPVERMRIDSTGAVFFPSLATTGSAANAFINNASTPVVNSILRSTSSLRYKANVATLPHERAAAVAGLRAIEFNSTCEADDPDHRMVGYAAEEVAAIDPTLVHWDHEGQPDGVQYDRVLLLKVAALEAEVEKLKKALKKTEAEKHAEKPTKAPKQKK